MSRSARDRLADIQTAIAKVYAYRPALRGEHSEMAVSAILREIGIIGETVNALPETSQPSGLKSPGGTSAQCGISSFTSTSTSTKAWSTMSSLTISTR